MITVLGGVAMAVSVGESKQLAQDDATRLHKLKKISLVLDLDHTLVHARARQFAFQRKDVRSLILPVVMNTMAVQQQQTRNQQQHPNQNALYNMNTQSNQQ